MKNQDPIPVIPIVGESLCKVCILMKVNTASLNEWYCPLINDVICETHCVEITAKNYKSLREKLRELFLYLSSFDDAQMMSTCHQCPHCTDLS